MTDLFNKLSDNIIITNTKGEILFIDNKLLSKLSYEKSELLGKNLINLLGNSVTYNKILNYKEDRTLEKFDFNIHSKFDEVIKHSGILSLENFNDEEAIFIICNEVKEELCTKEDLENFIDNMPFMCIMKDLDGRYLFTNKLALKALEEKKENVIGKYDKDIFNNQTSMKAILEDSHVIETKENLTVEKYLQKNDGYKRWFKMHKMPILNELEEIKSVGSISFDISLRKNIETKLDSTFEKSLGLDKDNIIEDYTRLDFIQSMLIKHLTVDGFSIWIYHEENDEMVSEFSHGISTEIIGKNSTRKFNSSDFKEFISRNDIEGIMPVSETKSYYCEDMLRYEVKYRGLYKISFNNKVIGLLSLVYKDTKPNFSQEDYIKKMCNELGMIIKNYSLYCELSREFHKRKKLEKDLEEFLNIATDIITIVDDNGKFIKINNEFSNLFGWSKEELTNMQWQNIVYPEDLKSVVDSIEETKKYPGVVKHLVNRNISKSGEVIWLDWSNKYLEDNKTLMCTAKNITEKKKMEEERKLYEKSLHLESIKSEFFANISHEFKTPLNIILATMQLINKGIENKDITFSDSFDLKRYIGSIKQNSYRLLRLVNNLIDMTRIDTGYYKINLQNANIVSIVEDITMSVAQYVEDKGISLIFDTEVEEEIIACDPDKMERIILNLLSNAIKYTSSQGKIDVNLSINNNNIVVSVKDDGIGIPKEKLKTIFDRFEQVDNTLTRKCEGSGIGLSLVKSLIELHCGTIIAKSEEGKGSEFIFELPIKTIESSIEGPRSENTLNSKIEKCIIEFSDIYN